ncbi:MAG: response regulator transcription factor [Chloroflexota bacterium]|nr:response regulator transcription factor [Chloroflexota bacterium]
MSEPIRLLIADDHEVVRQGLRAILEQEPGLIVVGEAADGESAVEQANRLRPDVLLLDIQMPGLDGVAVCLRLVEEVPEVAVIILTAFPDDKLVAACLRAGARGYLLKDIRGFDLPRMVRTVARGEAVLDPRVTDGVLARLRGEALPDEILTDRQVEILRLVAEGLSNREIGERLYLSEHTIKDYVAEIIAKLGVKNRVEAVASAIRQRLI